MDPLSAHYWMDLASAYEASGDDVRASDAYLRAKSVYPASAEVAFHYGNFLLREQRYREAYRGTSASCSHRFNAIATGHIAHVAIERGHARTPQRRAARERTEAYLQALDFFASIHQAQPALAVWQRLLDLRKPFPLPRAFPFFEELIREDREDEARSAWREALAAAGLPHDEPANQNLVWNGDFAQRVCKRRAGLAMDSVA